MPKLNLLRITTVPMSLDKLLEGQLRFMQQHFEVTAMSADPEGLKRVGEKEGVPVYSLPLTRKITPLRDAMAVWRLYRYLKKTKPTIVHTHTPKAGIVGMLAAKLAGVPLRLHTVAGLPLMEANGPKRSLLNSVEKATYGYATHVYPNSKGLYDYIVSEGLVPPSKLAIIGAGSSNGIDTSHFDPALFATEEKRHLRHTLQIDPNSFVYVFVGRLVGDKGINELVRAFKNLSGQSDGVPPTLLLVGPLEPELDPLRPDTLREIDNHPHIVSVGYQDDVRPYFAIANALVFPSYREGFPNVVLQAGAMGLPAIVTDINGCNEIVEDGRNGLLVQPKDAISLYDAMRRLVHDRALYADLAAHARPQITGRFERAQVWEALLAEYQRLLREKGLST
ncbi:MAG: glycosyltransferase family 1 protein [Flavobacteriaceae bacterium]|nr:glycosyltransferase family 1 protein [Flavobacteriaceae bacterium]